MTLYLRYVWITKYVCFSGREYAKVNINNVLEKGIMFLLVVCCFSDLRMQHKC